MNDEQTDNGASTDISIERRVKKHVRSRNHNWLAVCAPGLEDILRGELTGLGISPSQEGVRGGVEFEGRLQDGIQANLFLRTASRVLVRVNNFKARAVEDVFRETSAIPWEAWLPMECAVDLQTTIHESRIDSPTLLANTVRDAILRHFGDQSLPGPRFVDVAGAQKLLIRLDTDRMTLSLDSSGDLLHRRGWRRAPVSAPIRETLAASILLAAGYNGTEPLVDAMCGSGTFGIEGAMIATATPAGLSAKTPRPFAFMDWPSFPQATFNHMVSHAMPAAAATPAPIICRDIDPLALTAARRNADACVAGNLVRFEPADFLEAPPPCPSGLVVMNPPYGLRLQANDPPAAHFRRIARVLASRWRGWRYAIVLPDAALARQWPLPASSRLDFKHGGLDAVSLIGTI